MSNGSRGGSILGGIVLILIGAWFLLVTLGVNMPDIGEMWPIFPTLGGLAFIGMYLTGAEEDAGVLIPGVGGLLVGLFFFAITLGPLDWSDLDRWWPIFPLIGGIAFMVTWIFDRKETGLLVPGLGGVAVGAIAFVFTMAGESLAWLVDWWPLLLVIAGLFLLIQSLFRGR